MAKNYFFVLLLIMLLAQSCVKNEFTVSFELPNDVNANYQLQYYASDKRTGFQMENIANVEKGAGKAKCITRMPTIVYLYSPSSNIPLLVFYAERGDKITIKGENNNPNEWQISGNEINEKLSKWRSSNIKALDARDSKQINQAIANYAIKNPSDPVSLILLLTLFDRRQDEEQYANVWNKLKGDAKDLNFIRLIGRGDQPSDNRVETATVEKMKLYCVGDTIINYNPSSYDATLFYFNRNGSPKRKEVIDSLRKLTKLDDYKMRGMVVNVSFETDTTSWKNGIKKDSLSNVTQAWIFAGEADDKMMKINVPQTPFFIVCSKNGKELYHGSDYSAAAKEFRNRIMKKQ